MSASSGALAVYQRVDNPIAFATSMAKTFAAMTGVPLEQGEAVALTCLCEGLTPVDYRRRYHTIDGKPTMRADAMLAEFRMNHGGDYEIVERSANRAAINLIDHKQRSYPFEFTWEDCLKSRWPWKSGKGPGANPETDIKTNYSTPVDRRNMLWARLVSDAIRAVCPELVAGVYTPEEMEDAAGSGSQAAAPAVVARPTVAQIVAAGHVNGNGSNGNGHAPQQSVVAQATGEVTASGTTEAADDQSEDVVDAEFEPATTAVGSEGEAASGLEVDETDPTPGTISATQVRTLSELIEKLAMPKEAVDAMLAKRNVNHIRSLSKEQAKEIIGKLRDKSRQLAAVESGSPN